MYRMIPIYKVYAHLISEKTMSFLNVFTCIRINTFNKTMALPEGESQEPHKNQRYSSLNHKINKMAFRFS